MDSVCLAEVKRRLELIEKFIDLDDLEHYPASEIDFIRRYYKECDKYYKKLYHPAGFMHLGVSKDDFVRREDDEYRQLYFIEEQIHKQNAKKILELGCGQGVNSTYLAKKNPEREFIGIDLSMRKKPAELSNFTLIQGDYHELSGIADNSIDVIFIIEALCYSTQKSKFLEICHRKLTAKGSLIIVDPYASAANFEEPLAEKLIAMVSKSTMVLRFDPIDEMRALFKAAHFEIATEYDWTAHVIPAAKEVEAKALRLLRSRPLKSLARHLLPRMVRNNIVAGMFMALLCEQRIATYYYHQLVKAA